MKDIFGVYFRGRGPDRSEKLKYIHIYISTLTRLGVILII